MKKISPFFCGFLSVLICTMSSAQVIKHIGNFYTNGSTAIATKSNYVFVSNGTIEDVSNPALPILKGSFSPTYSISLSVLTDGNYAYYGSGMTVKLVIADISNLNVPAIKGELIFPNNGAAIYGMDKRNDVIYAAAGKGVYSIDVSDKTKPVFLDSLFIPSGRANDIVVKDTIAYTAYDDGFKILNISNPAKMKVMKSVGGDYKTIDVNGHLAFLAGGASQRVDVYDISNPQSPTLDFSINDSIAVWDIKARNNLIYCSTKFQGVYIYKRSSKAATKMARYPSLGHGQSFGIDLQGDLLFFCDNYNEVEILQYDSLGISTNTDEQLFSENVLFPNPANSYFEFIHEGQDPGFLEITDMLGRCVLRQDCRTVRTRVDISDLLKGEYLVTFRDHNASCQRKLIKTD